MTLAAPPHFTAPFSLDSSGNVNVAEQDSAAEVAACVYNIVVCPVGYRVEMPDFGGPDLAFRNQPLDTTALVSAVRKWEGRADVAVTSQDPVTLAVTQQGIAAIALTVQPARPEAGS